MAMNGDVLGLAILAAMDAYVLTLAEPKGDNFNREDGFKTLGGAIVAHIQSFGTVAVTVTSVTGVLTGGAVSGPGTGTGVIT